MQAIDGVLKTYYPSDSTGLFASLLQDKRVQTVIPSDTRLSEIDANLKTAIDSATDPSVRRAYLSVVADVTGTTIQQVVRDFNCTEHEAKEARIHARLHGPGACVKKVKFSRQRMSVSQCKFLTSMSVNRDFVYRPASTPTHTVQFKRKYSLREGYKVFLERLEQHNSELPPNEERIRKIGYAQYVEVMTGKGYSRLKPCQTGLCATCQDYGRENFEALKAWGTDVRKFCERI